MTNVEPIVITKKQAKHQINILGGSLIIYIILLILNTFVLPYYLNLENNLFASYDSVLIKIICASVSLLLVGLIVFNVAASLSKMKMREYMKKSKIKIVNFICYTSLAIGIQLLAIVVSYIASVPGIYNNQTYEFIGKFYNQTLIIQNIAYIIYYVFVVPIITEYIFRGVILRSLSHFGSLFGIITSSLLFAIVQSSLVEAIISFALGVVLGIVTMRYHSIRPAVQMHIISALYFLIWMYIPKEYSFVNIILVGIIFILLFIALFAKKYRVFKYMKPNNQEGVLFKLFFTSFTIITCLILFVGVIVASFIL